MGSAGAAGLSNGGGLGRWLPITEPITVAVAAGMARVGKVFRSDYDQHDDRVGQMFKVLGMVDPESYDFDECGPMYRIEFDDGAQIDAWPEEVEEPISG